MRLTRGHRELTSLMCVARGVAATIVAGGPTPADGPLLEVLLKARSVVSPPTEPPESAAIAVIAIDPRSLDAPFLAALSRHRDRVVLARSMTTVPARPFIGALRADPGAFGLGELAADRDGAYRRVRLAYHTPDGEVVPGLAAVVLRRGNGPVMNDAVLIAPSRHLETLPTYALIDVLRCAEAPEALGRAFQGKRVFVGTTMPEEDRRYTSGRLLAAPTEDGPPLHACGLRRLRASVPDSVTVPGVFIHAAAVDAVARNRVVVTASMPVVATLAAVSGGAGAVVGFALTP